MSDVPLEDDELSEPIIAALKSADQPLSVVTARVDRNIRALAVAQFSSRSHASRQTMWQWSAVAASILVGILIYSTYGPDYIDPGDIYTDIDQSGQIDIADVMALARSRRASQAEIDAFAMRVVALESNGGWR
jgi:hypothetical protein|tara:strand:+ start:4903 stop:5301 length:399 start_codon:yes stop_codon:yes gene_type:complete